MIAVTVDKPGDAATVTLDANQTLIQVSSATGIGGLTAALVDGQWPAQLIVRLRLRGLEHLQIRYGSVTIETGISGRINPSAGFKLSVTEPDGPVESGSSSAGLYYPVIRPGSDDVGTFFDITMPAHFLTGSYPDFSLSWVDFYR